MKQVNFILWLVVYLCVYTNVTAQDSTTYFNKLFQADTANYLSGVGRAISNGYVIAGDYLGQGGIIKLYIQQLNENGEQECFKPINIPSMENTTLRGFSWGEMATMLNDSILIGSYRNVDSVSNQYDRNLAAININTGTSLWNKHYTSPIDDYNSQTILTNDSCILMAGNSFNLYTGEHKLCLIKSTLAGDTVWTKTYDASELFVISLQQTWWDNGYILGCGKNSDAFGFIQGYVNAMKLDSLGNIKWVKNYRYADGNCVPYIVCATTPQQYYEYHYPIELYLTSYVSQHIIGNNYENDFYLAKIDTSGTIVWEMTYPDEGFWYNEIKTYYGPCTSPVIKKDRGLVSVLYARNELGHFSNLLVSFDFNGNILWQRPINLNPNEDAYVKDLQKTPDGGYLLTGFEYSIPRKSWVVKTDSLGNTCSFVGCDSTVYTGGVGFNPTLYPVATTAFVVSPNPANNNFTLSYQLPPNIAFGVLELYNTLGQKVLYKQAPQTRTEISVSVAQLPAGVYLYRFVTINGEAASGKIVVQH